MKSLTPEQVAIIRNDASRGTGLSDLARKYGLTWTEVLGIVNQTSHRTPLSPVDRIEKLELRVAVLEYAREARAIREREQNE